MAASNQQSPEENRPQIMNRWDLVQTRDVIQNIFQKIKEPVIENNCKILDDKIELNKPTNGF